MRNFVLLKILGWAVFMTTDSKSVSTKRSLLKQAEKIGGRISRCAEFFRSGRNLNLQENSPTKVGAQFLRHQLRTKVRSMVCFRLRHQTTHSCHWLQPVVDDEIFERRIYSATIRRARLLPCRKFFKRSGRSPTLQTTKNFRQCRNTAFKKINRDA